jgi:hypothetical protein
VQPLLADLTSGFADTQLARIEIGPRPAGDRDAAAPVLAGFPSHRMAVLPGDVFEGKRSRIQFSVAVVALLAGVFVVAWDVASIRGVRRAMPNARQPSSRVSHDCARR